MHSLLDDKFGGGIEQRGLGLAAALLLGTANGDHDANLTKKLVD
ncbi:MAG: hypothetical protein ACRDOI_43555 [Trebonia sp.]